MKMCKKFVSTIGICLFSMTFYAQTKILVTDGTNGLPSVDIFNSEQNVYFTTDTEGYFSIDNNIPKNIKLTISYIGYKTEILSIQQLIDEKTVILESGLLLDEVVMIGRTDERTKDIINQIESIKNTDIQATNPQTTADALAQHAGVFVQKSQMGGGSPVIRGFEANKVLLVVDGVRMNNAIYRGGHLQNAITIDASILERAEVIYGPGSLVYGSDALGGVIHFRSKNPMFAINNELRTFGETYIRYSTANKEKTAHFHLNSGNKTFSSLSSVTISDFNDLKTGNKRNDNYSDYGKRPDYITRINGVDSILTNSTPNVQIGTAYRQYDILQKISFRPASNTKLTANIQYSTSSNIPRYDALTERNDAGLKFAEWFYGPQKRWLASSRIDLDRNNTFFDKLITIISYQHIDEDRIDRRYKSDFRDEMNEDVNIWSLTTDLKKELIENWVINYGFEANLNTVTSVAQTLDIRSGELASNGITRYPSAGSNTKSIAAYLFTKKKFQHLDILTGMRYSYNTLNVKFSTSDDIVWPSEYYDGLTSTNYAFNWSVGGLYSLRGNWTIKSQIATAFRSPNIDDLAKIRIKNNEITVPNVDLNPEFSLTSEVTISKKLGRSYLSTTLFQTLLDNAIIRENFMLPNGSEYLIDEGDSLRIVANVNAAKARVRGISINVQCLINKHLTLKGSTNYIRGISINDDGTESPLAHIPPLYGKIGLEHKSSKHQTQIMWRYNGRKPLDQYGGSSDNPEYATSEGSLAWNTWNIYYTYNIRSKYRLAISLENIFDKHYRTFSSGVSAAGRNISVTLGVTF